jgi:signal transduction histidine kinase
MAEEQNSAHLQEINEEIYKRNLELAVVNKTLSLLRKLYQISLLSLDPASISEKISETVRVDLNMEVVGIFLYDEKTDSLKPFKFSGSERFLASTTEFGLDSLLIKTASKHSFTKEIITAGRSVTTTSLSNIWGDQIDPAKLTTANDNSHIKTVLLYPLVTQEKVIGMLLFGLNRSYETLNDFEQESINGLVNVVAVALDKALLYVQLKEANEQLKLLDKARAEFISIASHQLRTPPSTIKWYLGAVLTGDFGPLNPELKAALERTNVTNEAQISTIDDLLNASRIERGKLEFFFQNDDIKPVVAQLVEQMTPLAEMKKMRIVYRPPSDVFPQIMMDKEKVRQIINNMIDNAIKYSKKGDIEVILTKDDKDIILKVKDQGKGIAPGEVDMLFQKYSRGHDSVTHATGLGLGMYVAKVIVEQHNGKIWAESPGVGLGSTFCFSLPIQSEVKPTTVDLTQTV